MADPQIVLERLSVLNEARRFVKKVCKDQPLTDYTIPTTSQQSWPLFTQVPRSTVTTAEQMVNMTMDVANWLLEE
jgi:hypothetical protein